MLRIIRNGLWVLTVMFLVAACNIGYRTWLRPPPKTDCCSAKKIVADGVNDTRPGETYRVQGDPVMPRRLEDREAANLLKNWNRLIAQNEAMQFHSGERVRVVEIRRHVQWDRSDTSGAEFNNWSRVQSLERPQEAPVWIFNGLLHPVD